MLFFFVPKYNTYKYICNKTFGIKKETEETSKAAALTLNACTFFFGRFSSKSLDRARHSEVIATMPKMPRPSFRSHCHNA
jgi:hypothetical protein